MKNLAENLIKLKVNKKLLQLKLLTESGKIVTLKDISNLVTRMNAAEKRNYLQNAINNLQNQYGKFQSRLHLTKFDYVASFRIIGIPEICNILSDKVICCFNPRQVDPNCRSEEIKIFFFNFNCFLHFFLQF